MPKCQNVSIATWLLNVLNLVLIVSTLLLMLKLFFKTPVASNPSSHTRTDSTRSQLSKVIYKASCWDCNDFYIVKTKRRLNDRKTEHFKALLKHDHSSAIAHHIKATGHNIKWDHFDILASGKTDYHCKIKEPCLFKSCSQHWMPMSAVKSFYSIKDAFSLSLYRPFPFGNVLNFYCRCSLSRFQTPIVTV